MKKIAVLVFAMQMVFTALRAQTQEIKVISTQTEAGIKQLNDLKSRMSTLNSTVVKDSAGRVYTAEEWRKLMNTGEYGLRYINKDSAAVLTLYKLGAAQRQMMLNIKPMESNSFKTGEAFRYFTGRDIYGNVFNEDNLAGKTLVINFWSASALSDREIPALNQLVTDYAQNEDVVFLAVSKYDRASLRLLTGRTPFKYKLIEDGSEILEMYGISSFPIDVVVDKKGKVKFHTRGFGTSTVNYIRKMIEESIKGI